MLLSFWVILFLVSFKKIVVAVFSLRVVTSVLSFSDSPKSFGFVKTVSGVTFKFEVDILLSVSVTCFAPMHF